MTAGVDCALLCFACQDEEDEDEGSDEPPVASNKNKADGEASDAPKAKKQRT